MSATQWINVTIEPELIDDMDGRLPVLVAIQAEDGKVKTFPALYYCEFSTPFSSEKFTGFYHYVHEQIGGFMPRKIQEKIIAWSFAPQFEESDRADMQEENA